MGLQLPGKRHTVGPRYFPATPPRESELSSRRRPLRPGLPGAGHSQQYPLVNGKCQSSNAGYVGNCSGAVTARMFNSGKCIVLSAILFVKIQDRTRAMANSSCRGNSQVLNLHFWSHQCSDRKFEITGRAWQSSANGKRCLETFQGLPWLWNTDPGICRNFNFHFKWRWRKDQNSQNIDLLRGSKVADQKNLFLAKPIIYAR